jgi:Heavy metal binding domain
VITKTFTLVFLSLLVGCATSFDPKPLAADHPASVDAPEAPAGPRRRLVAAEGLTVRTQTQSSRSDAAETYWTCVMHPEIHAAAPGNCPKCGMTLVKKEAARR